MPSLISRPRTASTPPNQNTSRPRPPSLPSWRASPCALTQCRGRGASASGEAGYGAVGFLPTTGTLPADPHTPWAFWRSPHLLFQLIERPAPAIRGPIQSRGAYGLLSPARDAVLSSKARLDCMRRAGTHGRGALRLLRACTRRVPCRRRPTRQCVSGDLQRLFCLFSLCGEQLLLITEAAGQKKTGPKKRASPARMSSGCVSAGARPASCARRGVSDFSFS
jgi:hypothetical protein